MNDNVKGNKQIFLATVSYTEYKPQIFWEHLTNTLANAIQLIPLSLFVEPFDGGGLTVIRTLAESHIAIDTYVENKLAEIEVVSCKVFGSSDLETELYKAGLCIKNIQSFLKDPEHNWWQYNRNWFNYGDTFRS